MKKYLLSFFILMFTVVTAFAADTKDKSSESIALAEEVPVESWVLSFRGGLNGSQTSFRDWQSGGVNTLAITSNARFEAKYRLHRWKYNLLVNTRYGQALIDNEYRKTDDLLNIRNQFRYFLHDETWSALFDLNFRTQFDIGKDKDNINRISQFMAPGYLSQILGITYSPVDYFDASFGASMKQTFVTNKDLGPIYSLDPGDTFRNEAGFSFLINFEKEVFENVTYKTSVETFTNVNRPLDESNFTFSNELDMTINRYLSTNFKFVMHYDKDAIDKIQLMQVLSVGLTFRFI